MAMEESVPGYEDLTTIQQEIAFLKRAAWNATDPTKKLNHIMNLIMVALQIPSGDDVAFRCPECGHVTDSERWLQQVKEMMDQLDIERDEFDALYGSRHWPFEVVWQLHAATVLNDYMAILARVMQPLVVSGIVMDKEIDLDEAVEEALNSIMEGEVPDDTPPREAPPQRSERRDRGRKKGGDDAT